MTEEAFAARIRVNGVPYKVPCAPGEEDRVGEVAQGLDDRIRALAAELGDTSQSELLLLAALMLEDERAIIQNEVRLLRAELERLRTDGASDGKAAHRDQILAQQLLSAAARIAAISEKLDAA
jgi:cell division protein ZapA